MCWLATMLSVECNSIFIYFLCVLLAEDLCVGKMSIAKAAGYSVGKLTANNTMLFVCDIQEKFRKTIQYFDAVVTNSSRLLQAFKVLDMPIVCTEQYPKGQYLSTVLS